jgi:drug/metabolite transporter (DMT)-like permease
MKYHILAAITALIWGSTLISSKLLLDAGMTPAEIMMCRFLLGYLFLWILYPRTHRIRDWRDEGIFCLMGLFGGTVYFLAENTALYYTHTTNVALICATVPIVTAVLSHFIIKNERLTNRFFVGSIIAFAGVALVVLNGNFYLKLSPKGDILTFVAVLSWALYCVFQKLLRGKHNTIFITRNIFFYGMLTMLPYFLFVEPFKFTLEGFSNPVVWGNLCFLGLIASAICYYIWNLAINHIGVVKTNNYVYFLPLVTIIVASIFLKEHITIFSAIGTALIIGGLLWTSKKNISKKQQS